MKQLILYTSALICINTITKSHDYELIKHEASKTLNKMPIIKRNRNHDLKKHRESNKLLELKKFNKKPIINRYREYVFSLMNPQIEVFLAEFPNDPKSQIIERYLYQLSLTATLYKYYKLIHKFPKTNERIPEEIEAAYRFVPPNALVYHIILKNEIVNDVDELPYQDNFNAMDAWKDDLTKLEEQMIKELQKKSSSEALSLQSK